MSQVMGTLRILAVGGALLAVAITGCSKQRGTPFDSDAGHPDEFFLKHGASFMKPRADEREGLPFLRESRASRVTS